MLNMKVKSVHPEFSSFAKGAKLLQLCPTLCDPMDHSLPLSVGFSRQEYWSGLPFPSPADLPDPGIKPTSLMSPALAGRFFTTGAISDLQVGKSHAVSSICILLTL